jgi:hypothetical protein
MPPQSPSIDDIRQQYGEWTAMSVYLGGDSYTLKPAADGLTRLDSSRRGNGCGTGFKSPQSVYVCLGQNRPLARSSQPRVSSKSAP